MHHSKRSSLLWHKLSLYPEPEQAESVFSGAVYSTSSLVVQPGQLSLPAKHMYGKTDSPGCSKVCTSRQTGSLAGGSEEEEGFKAHMKYHTDVCVEFNNVHAGTVVQ